MIFSALSDSDSRSLSRALSLFHSLLFFFFFSEREIFGWKTVGKGVCVVGCGWEGSSILELL